MNQQAMTDAELNLAIAVSEARKKYHGEFRNDG
jgi:hypothetical protein